MTGWEVLNNVVGGFPFVVTALFALGALIALGMFIVGFSKYGVDFVKHGLKQKGISDLGEKIDGLDTRFTEKINGLDARFTEKINGLDSRFTEKIGALDSRFTEKISALDTRFTEKINGLDSRFTEKINGLRDEFHTEITAISVNHFGHLKNYLGILNGILLDKQIIGNETKAQLDNELRGM
jgi:hypothetical protein